MACIYKLRYFILLFIIVLAIIYWLKTYAQIHFFFAPDNIEYDSPKRKKLKYEDIYFKSTDGTKLHAWFIPAKNQNAINAKASVIQFHGNSQNLSSNWQLVEWLPEHGYNVFVFDYRGYGKSQGKITTLKGFYEDGVSALNYLHSRQDIDVNKIFVLGQSIGVSSALNAINQNKSHINIKGVILEGGFYSYSKIAEDYYKFSGLFVDDSYSPANFIDKISPIPLMIMHGVNDEVINYRHGEMLYEKAKQPKTFIPVRGGHIKAFFLETGKEYQKIMLDFLEKNLKN